MRGRADQSAVGAINRPLRQLRSRTWYTVFHLFISIIALRVGQGVVEVLPPGRDKSGPYGLAVASRGLPFLISLYFPQRWRSLGRICSAYSRMNRTWSSPGA